MTGDRWLVAGLGNPGPSYAGNRHNAGYLTADVLAARAGVRFRAGKFRAATAEGRVAGSSVIIVKPLTFMNDSGIAVAARPAEREGPLRWRELGGTRWNADGAFRYALASRVGSRKVQERLKSRFYC